MSTFDVRIPDWYNNTVLIKGKNKEAIDRVVGAYKTEKLFEEFIPVPDELKRTTYPNKVNSKEMTEKYGYPDWYTFQEGKWGTKWCDKFVNEPIRLSDTEVILSFNTSWTPPTGIYQQMISEGYEVDTNEVSKGEKQ
jgi:hypothetical protein